MNKHLKNLSYRDEYLNMINDFLLTMLRKGIDDFKQPLNQDASVNLIERNSWMLNFNIIVSNNIIKSIKKQFELIKSIDFGEFVDQVHVIFIHVERVFIKYKWQISTRSKLGIYDEKFWNMNEILELRDIYTIYDILNELA